MSSQIYQQMHFVMPVELYVKKSEYIYSMPLSS